MRAPAGYQERGEIGRHRERPRWRSGPQPRISCTVKKPCGDSEEKTLANTWYLTPLHSAQGVHLQAILQRGEGTRTLTLLGKLVKIKGGQFPILVPQYACPFCCCGCPVGVIVLKASRVTCRSVRATLAALAVVPWLWFRVPEPPAEHVAYYPCNRRGRGREWPS